MSAGAMHVHDLLGCQPSPLAHYLKAFGILRLIAQQADPDARGWWQGESFHLATRLDTNAVEAFFLEAYSPTPLVAPWNGGSGFYSKDNRTAITLIEKSVAPRFEEYRAAIASALALLGGTTEKPSPEEKARLFARARRVWRGSLLDWLDAAVLLDADGQPSYPPILGTGGNDGRLDFTNNFMQRLCSLFDCSHAAAAPATGCRVQLHSSLFGGSARVLESAPAGMFLPGSGGGPNSGSGFAGRAAANPWDYVLMLEGAVCFHAGIAERSRTISSVSSPFLIPRSSTEAAGYGTAGHEADTRGEQWFPLWSRPALFAEVGQVLREGRRQVGRSTASSSTDMARATARLGVARGISAFERYGYFERNGQAFVAVPLGRWAVREQRNQRLLDQVQGWVDALSRVTRSAEAPSGVTSASQRCTDAVLACARDGANRAPWQELLIALGAAECALCRSRRFAIENRLRPLPRITADWVDACDDESPELRLAISLASLSYGSDGTPGTWNPRSGIRSQFIPIDHRGQFSDAADDRVAQLDDFVRVACAIVQHALLRRNSVGGLPLVGHSKAGAPLDAVVEFLEARTDDKRILSLARGLMAVDWTTLRKRLPMRPARSASPLAMAFALARLAYSPTALVEGMTIKIDARIFHRLDAGDLPEATCIASQRLSVSGLRPLVSSVLGSAAHARRVAAALAFGVDFALIRDLREFATEPSTHVGSEEALL